MGDKDHAAGILEMLPNHMFVIERLRCFITWLQLVLRITYHLDEAD